MIKKHNENVALHLLNHYHFKLELQKWSSIQEVID